MSLAKDARARMKKGTLRPVNVRGASGSLAGVYFPPIAKPSGLGDILLAPAFGEEMNRCRAMVAVQARSLAELGCGTLILDLFGTGDSAGEYVDASWARWQDDIRRGVDWLRDQGNGCRTLWGIRTGAMLAAHVARRDAQIVNLLFWQPVVSGKAYFTQFLRIRIAAEIAQADGIKSTEQLRHIAAMGEPIEVSGYRIGSTLAAEMDQIALPGAFEISGKQVGWFEVVASDDANVPRANVALADAYRGDGVPLKLERVVAPPFWNLHERTLAPSLISATSQAVSDWIAQRSGQENSVEEGATAEVTDISDSRPRDARMDGRIDDVETARIIECDGDELVGVLHAGRAGRRRGVVIVVAGGPQYRVGAHRQFVSLARRLAAIGYAVLRFDLRGMGDSSGTYVGFQQSEPDIRCAIDCLIAARPDIDEVVLLGECESASGILFYAHQDPRVKGVVLVNPWVRTEGGRAEVMLKHYYVRRLLSREFWDRIRHGEFRLGESLRSFFQTLWSYARGRSLKRLTGSAADTSLAHLPLPVGTGVGLRRFTGPVLIVMSGNDYIAREFDEVIASSRAWEGLLADSRVQRRDLLDADHTFSRETWKRQASDWVCDWMAAW